MNAVWCRVRHEVRKPNQRNWIDDDADDDYDDDDNDVVSTRDRYHNRTDSPSDMTGHFIKGMYLLITTPYMTDVKLISKRSSMVGMRQNDKGF